MRHVTTLLVAPFTLALLAGGCATEGDVADEAAHSTATESVHAFECVTVQPMEDGTKHALSFSVVGLDAPDFDEDFLWPDDESDDDCPGCPVSVTPSESLLTALNENGVVKRDGGNLLVEGDADGFYAVTMKLFENSGYTKGYVRIEDGGGFVVDDYSEVHCTVTQPNDAPDQDLSEVLGIYSNFDHEYEESAPLMLALHAPTDAVPDGYAGHVDLSRWDGDTQETTVERGWFTVAETDAGRELTLVTEDGEPLATGAWVDGDLQIEGALMLPFTHVEEWLAQCYALHVHHYEFEEGFTPYEYPGVDVIVDDDGVRVGFGAASFDEDEATITVGQTDDGAFEATVQTEWSTYVLRIPPTSPRRGQVLFGQDGALEVMADLACFE